MQNNQEIAGRLSKIKDIQTNEEQIQALKDIYMIFITLSLNAKASSK